MNKLDKNEEQNQEASLTDAYSLFIYAIRTKITRDYYLRRLRSFFDYIEIHPSAKIEFRCNEFAALAIKDHNWTFNKLIAFLQFQKERVQREEIIAATLYNFVKALKLFCEMSDIPVSWKKITRGLPKVRSFANDKECSIIIALLIQKKFSISFILWKTLILAKLSSQSFRSLWHWQWRYLEYS